MNSRLWQCNVCTYSNSLRLYPHECEMCGSPRSSADPELYLQPPNEASGGLDSVGNSGKSSSSSSQARPTNSLDKPIITRSSRTKVCPTCTFINKGSATECEVCISSFSSIDQNTSRNDTRSDEQSEDSDGIQDVIHTNLHLFAVKEYNSSGRESYRCRLDGRTFSTKSLMIAYIEKNHYEQVRQLIEQSSDDIATEEKNSDQNIVSDDVDYTLALDIAMKEFEESQSSSKSSTSRKSNNRPRESTRSSSTLSASKRVDRKNRLKTLVPASRSNNIKKSVLDKILSGDNSDDEDLKHISKKSSSFIGSDAHTSSTDQQLNSLLVKMDRIVHNIHKLMSSISNKHNQALKQRDTVLDSDKSPSHSIDQRVALQDTLRDYQIGGVKWLLSLNANGLNGILADEMGLGKTMQVLSFLSTLWEQHGISGPHLIVMPLSVITSWQADIAKYFPSTISVLIHYGEKSERTEAFLEWCSRITAQKKRGRDSNPHSVNIVLTSYDLVIKDKSLLQKVNKSKLGVNWEYIVVDEAHRLKNRESILFQDLECLSSEYRLLLTGTPLQNNLEELWSLLGFTLPKIFHDIRQLSDWFNQPFEVEEEEKGLGGTGASDDSQINGVSNDEMRTGNHVQGLSIEKSQPSKTSRRGLYKLSQQERDVIISSLHRILKPFILRRLKQDVMLDIMPKIERTVYCPLSPLQISVQNLIRDIVRAQSKPNNYSILDPTDRGLSNLKYRLTLNNIVMQLRKLCCHPYLVLEDMRSIPDDLYDKYLISSCGKLSTLHCLLQELLPRRHKILIFSQFTTMLDIIQGYLYNNDIDFARFDGSVSRDERIEQLNKFKCDDCLVFLLSTRSGGVGLNLQRADTVIIYDSDWNPQQDLQAMSRAHRLGQTKEVLVLRLVMTYHSSCDIFEDGSDSLSSESRGGPLTIEEKMLKKAAIKLKTEKEVMADGQFDMGTATDKTSFEREFMNELKNEYKNELDKSGELTLVQLTEENASIEPSKGQRCDLLSADYLMPKCLRSSRSTGDGIEDYNDEDIRCQMNSSIDVNRVLTQEIEHDWKKWLQPGSSDGPENSLGLETFNAQRLLRSRNSNSLLENELNEKERQELAEEFGAKNKKKKRKCERQSKCYAEDEFEEFLDESDICQLCKRPWLELEDVKALDKVFQMTNAHEIDGDDVSNSSKSRSNLKKLMIMRETLIICESCEGCFHVLCVGLTQVPSDDWFCTWCLSSSTVSPRLNE